MKKEEIRIRDPFILPESGRYYMYGSANYISHNEGAKPAFSYSVSLDLENWSELEVCFERPDDFWGTVDFWAPEVHKIGGKFYMFASFYNKERKNCHRGTGILVADRPQGPFTVWCDRITPEEWDCLDGTYYEENGVPYLVFSHEWCQIHDGEICYMPLTADLKHPAGEPVVMLRASEPHWAKKDCIDFITDGPFMVKQHSGRLVMLWSSFDANGYVEAVAVSDNGSIKGNWNHCRNLLSAEDGGHGMIFRDQSGNAFFSMHRPNEGPLERAVFIPIAESDTDPFFKLEG